MRPVILTIPHAATTVPEELSGRVILADRDIIANSDCYTDRLFAVENTHIVTCSIPRILLDVNRAPDDISREYERGRDGVVVHTTPDGKKVYVEEPTEADVADLIEKYHDPFHEQIDAKIPDASFLVDCHSYAPVGLPGKPDEGMPRPDINLGNVNFTTCTREHTVFFREFFERHGYGVSINFPYKGRYTLGRHCHRRRIPHFLVPGIQIEINQKLYLKDVETFDPDDQAIAQFNGLIKKLVGGLIETFALE